jgi:23S rRNA pseudouridine1911/1915/1917 synthase
VGEPAIETKDGGLIERPGIVHRLDKDTSGVMNLVKTDEGYERMKEQFQNRSVKKTYHAWVYGEMKDEQGVIEAPIGRSKTFAKWTAIPKALRGTAREAQTEWRVIRSLAGFTELTLHPTTGRTHQIRVHLQYKNYPIVADHLYAGKRFNVEKPASNLGFTRQALHAESIVFKDINGQEVTVQAPLPTDFQQTEQYLQ